MTLLHVIAVIVTGCLVLFADEQAFRWFLGRKECLSRRLVEFMHISVGLGLAALILTGGLIFVGAPQIYLQDPTFLLKLVFVGALIVNTFFIERLSYLATKHPFRALPRLQRMKLFASGMISFGGWVGAGICGLILGGVL